MKIILLHDYFSQIGGAEKVLFSFLDLFPNSRVYSLFYNKKSFPNLSIKSSFIQFLPFKKKYKIYTPLFPLALKFFRFENECMILSSSHAWIKNIKKPKTSLHICYCHTPMRYAWGLKKEYLEKENILTKPLVSLFLTYLRYWDKKNSKNVDFFIANSKNVANRIKKYYNRESIVIYPPINTNLLRLNTKKRKDFYLVVSRLIEYKKTDLAIEAFKKLNKKLIIAGTGRDEKRLKKLAKGCDNIIFLGRIPEDKLKDLYQNAKAFINPQIEDFGITSLESQSCGTPVIAYAKGGALETVIQGKTGHFFHKQTPESLINAIKEFESMKFNPKECRKNALKFDQKIFKKSIKDYIDKKYKEFQNAQNLSHHI